MSNKKNPMEGGGKHSRSLATVLALYLSFGLAGNALACSEGAIACGDDCAADDGKSTCNWEISSNGKLTITGSGAMKSNSNRTITENTAARDTYTTDASYGDYWDKITSVEIGNGITDTGARAFQGLSNVTSVSIPSSLTTVGEKTFDRMSGLNTVTIPENSKLTTIGEQAFSNSGSLGNENAQKILDTLSTNNLANGTTFDISRGAFSNCNLTEIDIPAGTNRIEGAAFSNEDNGVRLNSLTIADGVTYIGNSAFYKNNIETLELPDSVKVIDAWAFYDNDISDLTLSNSLTTISDYAFESNDLTSVVIPDSVVGVGKGAFAGNGITSLTIPDTLQITISSINPFDSPLNLDELIISDGFDSILPGRNFFSSSYEDIVVRCQGDLDKCKTALSKYLSQEDGGTCKSKCLRNSNFTTDMTKEQCETGKYVWKDGKCQAISESACSYNPRYYYNGSTCKTKPADGNITCGSSHKANGTECDRIRYTPAEAAKVVRDDNNNQIVITFKK